MRQNLIWICTSWLLCTSMYAQEYWGAGESENIKVTSSHSWQQRGWTQEAAPSKTIEGQGLDARLMETSRFLSQATLGVPREVISEVADMEFETWIDQQFEVEPRLMLDQLDDTWDEVVSWYVMNGGDSTEIFGPFWKDFNYAWFTATSTSDDYLRHRIALALSEILVISINSELGNFGRGLSSYYDVLYRNAFGNYRDLLEEVTLHPCMGFYLSHLNNPKSDPVANIQPDENYAREVMQLFSIGLYELNNDGTRKTDSQGNFIPTYGQSEITEFAKVFTGLGISEIVENQWIDSAQFDLSIYLADMTKPMRMYEEWHEPGEKELLNDFVVPAGQSGMEDIRDALDNIFSHPNVGPFISRLLIQQMVKSNPSPAYIERVVAAFNNDGQGIRGNMKAVVKAILLDEEARTCEALSQPSSGKLRSPLLRYTHFIRSVETEHPFGRYWNVNYGFWDDTGMSPLWAPSVFNFYLPDHQPQGEIANQNWVAPEFQLHNTKLSIGYINQVNGWTVWNNLMSSWEQGEPPVGINIDHFKQFADDPEVLVNELDKIYTHGSLSDHTREAIKEAIEQLIWSGYKDDRVRLAIYLIMISPDYTILR